MLLWALGCAGGDKAVGSGADPLTETAPAVCAPVLAGDVEYPEPEALAALVAATPSIDGSLLLGGVDTLAPLAGLCRVGGDLRVQRSELPDMHGLEDLGGIGGTLALEQLDGFGGADGAEGFAGLEGLIALGGLLVRDTAATDLALPPGLTGVAAVSVVDNGRLLRLSGGLYTTGALAVENGYLEELSLPLLREAGAIVITEWWLERADLSALEQASSISIYSQEVEVIAPALSLVSGDMSAASMAAGQAFPALRWVGGALSLGDMDRAVSLPLLEEIGAMELSMFQVTEWPEWPMLRRIGVLSAERTTGMGRMAAFAGVEELGSLSLTGTDAADLSGLSSLQRVTGDLVLSGNAGLSEAEIAAFLERVEVRGAVITE